MSSLQRQGANTYLSADGVSLAYGDELNSRNDGRETIWFATTFFIS